MDIQFIEEIRNIKCIKCLKLSLKQKKFIIYSTLAFFAGSGFILILLGCDLWPNGWWSLFVLFGIVFSAIPDILINRLCVRNDNFDKSSRTCCSHIVEDALFVIAGFFSCIPFVLPFVLMHNRIISGNTVGLVVSGSFLIMASSFIFMKLIYNKKLIRFCHKNIDEDGNAYSSEEDGYVFSFIGRDNDDLDEDGEKEEFIF